MTNKKEKLMQAIDNLNGSDEDKKAIKDFVSDISFTIDFIFNQLSGPYVGGLNKYPFIARHQLDYFENPNPAVSVAELEKYDYENLNEKTFWGLKQMYDKDLSYETEEERSARKEKLLIEIEKIKKEEFKEIETRREDESELDHLYRQTKKLKIESDEEYKKRMKKIYEKIDRLEKKEKELMKELEKLQKESF